MRQYALATGIVMSFVLSTAGLAVPEAATSPKVVARTRLGNETEDMEVIRAGLYKGWLAFMDGMDVNAVPAPGQSDQGDQGDDDVRTLFNIKRLPLANPPRGIGYVESERLFVYDDPGQIDRLIFSDERGNPAGTRTIVYPAGFTAFFAEALAYVPPTSAFYPDRILQVTYDDNLFSHVLVINRDGTVEADIVPDDPAIQDNGLVAVSAVSGERLLVSVARNTMFFIDWSGHTVLGPVELPEIGPQSGIEGVGQIDGNRFVATDHDTGRIYALDGALHRKPLEDRRFTVGIGLSGPSGLAWNPDTRSYLLFDFFSTTVQSVSEPVRRKQIAADVGAAGFDQADIRDVVFVPDARVFGITSGGTLPPFLIGLQFFDSTGGASGTLPLTGLGRPTRASYFTATHEYGVNSRTLNTSIAVVDGAGHFSRLIKLGPVGVTRPFDYAYFDPADPSGGKLLVMTPTTAFIVDLNGVLVSQFDYRTTFDMVFGADYVTAITSGRYAGAFAAHAFGTNELVVFQLN